MKVGSDGRDWRREQSDRSAMIRTLRALLSRLLLAAALVAAVGGLRTAEAAPAIDDAAESENIMNRSLPSVLAPIRLVIEPAGLVSLGVMAVLGGPLSYYLAYSGMVVVGYPAVEATGFAVNVAWTTLISLAFVHLPIVFSRQDENEAIRERLMRPPFLPDPSARLYRDVDWAPKNDAVDACAAAL
ncbi:membrane hypothetical protein [Azospirillaceae bacterium]